MGKINYRTILIGQKKGVFNHLRMDLYEWYDSSTLREYSLKITGVLGYILGLLIWIDSKGFTDYEGFEETYLSISKLTSGILTDVVYIIISFLFVTISVQIAKFLVLWVSESIIISITKNTKGQLYIIICESNQVEFCYTTSRYPPLYDFDFPDSNNPESFQRWPNGSWSWNLSEFFKENEWKNCNDGIQIRATSFSHYEAYFTVRNSAELRTKILQYGWEFFIRELFEEIGFMKNFSIDLKESIKKELNSQLTQNEETEVTEYKYISEVFRDDVLKAFTTNNQLEDLVNINKSKHPLAHKIRETMM
jgi:hypothetical protein